jgi:hypothetical protein
MLFGTRGASVLECGAGALRNALYLQRRGMAVTVLEIPETRERFAKAYKTFEARGGRALLDPLDVSQARFQFALMTFVIEAICRPEERRRLLACCRRALVPEGKLLISARGVRDVVTANRMGKRCGDGFVTPQRTFVRAYTRTTLESTVTDAGFSSVSFLHKSSTYRPELIHAVAQA